MLVEPLHQQINVASDHRLLLFHSAIGKVVRYPFPQLCVFFRASVKQTNRPLRSFTVVLVGFFKLASASGAVDILPGASINEAYVVEAESDNWPVSVEQILGVVRKFAFQARKYEGQIRDTIEEWPWVFVEGVKEQPVDSYSDHIQSTLIT